MACTLTPTGLPTLEAISFASGTKSYNASLGLLVPRIVNGYADHFDIEWVVDPLLTQTIRMAYKEVGAVTFTGFVPLANQLEGVITSATGLATDTEFDFWIRRETATEYGPWNIGYAICQAGWHSDINIVYRLTIEVQYGGETVYYFVP